MTFNLRTQTAAMAITALPEADEGNADAMLSHPYLYLPATSARALARTSASFTSAPFWRLLSSAASMKV